MYGTTILKEKEQEWTSRINCVFLIMDSILRTENERVIENNTRLLTTHRNFCNTVLTVIDWITLNNVRRQCYVLPY